MNKNIPILSLLAVACLTACRDSFDIDTLNEQPKLVVNCLPSEADTTWIDVTHSIPVAKGAALNDPYDYLEVTDAHIIYKVNGQQRPVGWRDRQYNRWSRPVGPSRYYTVGAHRPGDRVEVAVEAPGYTPVSAETTVAAPIAITLDSVIRTRAYDTGSESSRNVYQLVATFTDPPQPDDYYAVRIRTKHYRTFHIGEDNERTDSTYLNPVILTMSEPLLQPLSDLDGDFGFDNEYYQQFYTFSDEAINGQTYTLHLNLAADFDSILDGTDQRPVQYQVQLYHLTPEYYHYVTSVNDIDNNDLAQRGLSMLSPTYTNVRDGIGIVGAYFMTATRWLPATPLTSNP